MTKGKQPDKGFATQPGQFATEGLESITFSGDGLRNLTPHHVEALGRFAAMFGINMELVRNASANAAEETKVSPIRGAAYRVPEEGFEPPLTSLQFAMLTGLPDALDKQAKLNAALQNIGIKGTAMLAFPDERLGQPLTAAEQHRFRLLNKSVDAATEKFITGPNRTRALNGLDREGVHTIAHVLIAGKKQIATIRNFGQTGMDALTQALLSDRLLKEWKDYPSMRDIGGFCFTLAQLPSFLATGPDQHYDYRELSIRDIITMSVEELARKTSSNQKVTARAIDIAIEVQDKARNVAVQFLAERRRVMR